ncbi:MAG: MgtC/SapB family protein [Vicinamibacterales bacterium]
MPLLDAASLLIAALGGAAVGLERQWSGHADGPNARFGGIRTFTMLGAIGGLSGWLWTEGVTIPAAILLAAAAAIVAGAYTTGSRQDIDGTTEVAAILVIGSGVISGMGFMSAASAVVALEVLLLVEKSRLHALAARVDEVGLRSGVRFGVMALVILPLLPEGPFGPWGGIRPRELWLLVLFFSALSFAAYIAQRLAGAERGYLAAGALGGLISSTNVTFTFARMKGESAVALGAVAANLMLYPRVLVATAILNTAILPHLLPYLVPPVLVAGAWAALLISRRRQDDGPAPIPIANPLRLREALQMAAVFQVVLTIVAVSQTLWGRAGTIASAAILGLTDVDALTVSMARSSSATPAALAALAIGVGILANTAMKLGVALLFGNSTFRASAGGALALMLSALALSVWWLR